MLNVDAGAHSVFGGLCPLVVIMLNVDRVLVLHRVAYFILFIMLNVDASTRPSRCGLCPLVVIMLGDAIPVPHVVASVLLL
jgi:hypothetical protein